MVKKFFKNNNIKLSKTFFELYVSYTLIFIIPIFFIGVISYKAYSKNIEKEINNYNFKILKQINNNFEISLNYIENSTMNLLKNTNVSEFINEDKRNYYTVYKLSEEIKWISESNESIDDIFILDIDKNEVLSTKNGLCKIDSIISNEWLKQIYLHNVKNKWLKTNLQEPVLVDSVGGELIYIQSIPLMGLKSEGYIIVVVNEQHLWSKLKEVVVDKYSQVYVVNSDGNIISSNKDVKLYDVIDKYIEKISNNHTGNFLDEKDSKNMILYLYSNKNNWLYLSITEWDKKIKILKDIEKNTNILILIMSIIGAIICYFVSKKMYRPLSKFFNNIIDSNSKYSEVIGSNKSFIDEYKYLSDIFYKIKVSNEESTNFFKRNSSFFKEKLINDLLRNRISYEENIMEKIKYFSIPFYHNYYFVYIIEIDYSNLYSSGISIKERRMCNNVIKTIAEKVISKQFNATAVEDWNQNVSIVCNIEHKTDKVDLIKLAKLIKDQIFIELDISASIGIGRIYKDITNIFMSYRDAERALKYRLIIGHNIIVHIEDISKIDGEILYYYPIAKEKMLINFVKNGDMLNIDKLVKEIVSEIKNQPNLSIECILQVFNRLLSSVINIVLELGGDMKEIFGKRVNVYSGLSENKTLEDIQEWVLNIFQQVTKYINSVKNENENMYINIVKKYINNHFTEDISLDKLASEVNLSSNYISTLFKEKIGINIIKYVNRLRIEKSKQILKESDLTIREISRQLGYNDQHSFIRYFKKFEGITPGKYREHTKLELGK